MEKARIDWIRIGELYEDLGASHFNDVLTAFLEESSESLARLIDAESSSALQSEFHFLKGAAVTLGFDEIAAICSSGEKAAEAGEPAEEQRAALLQNLPHTISALSSEWRTKLGIPE